MTMEQIADRNVIWPRCPTCGEYRKWLATPFSDLTYHLHLPKSIPGANGRAGYQQSFMCWARNCRTRVTMFWFVGDRRRYIK